MRRPYCVEWSPGRTWASGTEVEISDVSPLQGRVGKTFQYTLRRLDGSRGTAIMTQDELKRDTRPWVAETAVSSLTQS